MNHWPAARSSKVAAGVKVNVVVSEVADGTKSVKLVSESTAEVKTLKLGPWVKNRILLLDLGYFKYGVFDRIDRYNGYFVSRLKDGADPLIVGVNRTWRGRTAPVVGELLQNVLLRLKRQIIDVDIEIKFKKRQYRRKRSQQSSDSALSVCSTRRRRNIIFTSRTSVLTD